MVESARTAALPASVSVPRSDTAITHGVAFSVSYEYAVCFTRGIFDPDNALLADVLSRREPNKRHRCLVFVDSGVVESNADVIANMARYADTHSASIDLVDAPIRTPGGETVKTERRHLAMMQEAIRAHKIDRHSYVIAVGGGAVLDAVGYAAAIAHRGVRLVRAPTTVLAQNDAGIGVKNAVNLEGVKNYLGTFQPPWAVLNDFDFLSTLPRRDRIAGIAEAVKVALIRDQAFYEWIEQNAAALKAFEPSAEAYMIRRCAELHLHQITHGGDPFEGGSARPLDFGHWSAHKLEALTAGAVRHGEAVAIGIALDARYSVLAGLLSAGEDDRIVNLLERLGLSTWHAALVESDGSGRSVILGGLEDFQEHLGGALTVTLLRAAGRDVEVNSMNPVWIADALKWLAARKGPQ